MSGPVQKPETRPRVLVTRASEQASALAEALEQLGAETVSIPILEIGPPDSFPELDAALTGFPSFDWLLFTSANAVRAFTARAHHLGRTLALDGIRTAAIGPATARALEAFGHKPDLVPPTAVAESLAEALLPFVRREQGMPTRFLLIRAQEARDHLPEVLRTAGAEVTIAAAYKTRMPSSGIDALKQSFLGSSGPPHGVTLTSSSAARNFFAVLAAANLCLGENTAIASIGPITSATLRELGHPPHTEAREASVQSLAEAMMNYLKDGTEQLGV